MSTEPTVSLEYFDRWAQQLTWDAENKADLTSDVREDHRDRAERLRALVARIRKLESPTTT